MKTFTHRGELYGDARVGDKKPWVYLRETTHHWIDHCGSKYRKTNGSGMGDWPLWSLDLDTIKELTTPLRK